MDLRLLTNAIGLVNPIADTLYDSNNYMDNINDYVHPFYSSNGFISSSPTSSSPSSLHTNNGNNTFNNSINWSSNNNINHYYDYNFSHSLSPLSSSQSPVYHDITNNNNTSVNSSNTSNNNSNNNKNNNNNNNNINNNNSNINNNNININNDNNNNNNDILNAHEDNNNNNKIDAYSSIPGCSYIITNVGEKLPKRRNTANRKERRRTHSINSAFSRLRDCIPNVPADTKLSKIKTLRLAKEYIVYLTNLLVDTSSNNNTIQMTCEDFKVNAQFLKGVKRLENSLNHLKAINNNKQSSNYCENLKKSKGRTGWPQDVWASNIYGLELKQDHADIL